MSAITSEWLLISAQEAAVRPARDDGSYSREAKFRVALDGYMAGYVDHQQRRAGIIGGKTRHPGGGVGARLVVWLRNGSVFAKSKPKIMASTIPHELVAA